MSRYEQELRAYGIPADVARRDAFVNEIGRLDNREQYAREQYEASARADGPCAAINYETHRGE